MPSDPMVYFSKYTSGPNKNGCIIWTGAKSPNGYGVFQKMSAHRWLYEYHHKKKLPANVDVHHTCFNHDCVNIDHLDTQTHQKNSQIRKGANKGSTSGMRNIYYRPDCTHRPYRVQVMSNGKQYTQTFKTLELAQEAAEKMRRRLH
jgi:hypothetical protein